MVREKKIVFYWLFMGILLRIIFMPFTLHPDLLHIYYHPYFLAFKNIWDIYSYHADFFKKYVCYYYPPLTYLFFGSYLYIVKPFLNGFDKFMEAVGTVNYSGGGHSGHYLISAGIERLPRFLFLMKLPYLFFDAALLMVLLSFAKDNGADGLKKRNNLSKWWALNPLLIYTSYLFGQFDIIPAVFISLGAFLAFRKKGVLAMFFLGLGAAFKSFPVFLIFPFAFYLGKNIRGIIKYIFAGVLPLVLIVGPFYLLSKGEVMGAFFGQRIAQRLGFMNIWGVIRIVIFALAYVIICLSVLKKSIRERMGELWPVKISFLTLALVFIIFPISFHYFLWTTPFVLIMGCNLKPKIINLYMLAVLLLGISTFIGKGMGLGLLSPIYPEFFMGLPSLDGIIIKLAPYKLIKHVAVFAFIWTLLWMSILILKDKKIFSHQDPAFNRIHG